ncbi:TaqI-like C-terminal specificity domain-containing protein [Halobacterium salinarum]|uniref:Eco57I restriction-modification methylase domain-containing protein n=1 Tax=Halobacterium salinarum TaxID=2242 RepID=UPI002553D943|nr:TaqI-like C-terminal specificity domain-containing protein [Halobacterium salinarum]MDL0118800.1 TaqI-like C-terminal specificity domain-containing protein [Halobacterium salinarum]
MQTALTYRTNRDLFSNHYLDEHLPETEEWDEVSDEELQEAYDDIMALWEREKDTAPKRNESQLEEKFIRPMFRKLGIPFEVEESTSRTQRRPDYGFFETEEAARSAFERRDEGGDFYRNAVAVADAKRWGRPLDTRGSGEHERDFENPSYQIHVYLQEVDDAQWAVLTDGKKWRLYYGPTSHRLDSYYEVDLPTVLESGDLEDFKYFYLFFRHEAFLEDGSGDSFLDDVYDESNVFAQELGEDLQDNIYEAIKILSEGYLQYPENDLDEDDLDLIHDSSLIYLYRLIFVLYAEAEGRELLDTSNEIYEQTYSLNSLKQEIAEELDSGDPKYRDWQDNLQSRLDELFTLIDKGSKSRGIPEEDLYIPAYNGGLFRTDPDEDDSAEAKFLANHDVGDAYLAKVVELLTRSKNNDGGGKIFVDYSSLDVRHLGSIYEGLLEYQLNVADEPLALDDGEYVTADEDDDIVVQEDEVYLTTDSGERKATGSYYTPEYIVEYIVENTLEPLVDDIRADLAGRSARGEDRGFAEKFAERIFDLKILDPAMGSGHFLTSAIDYLAREIIDAQEKQAAQQGIETVNQSHDINWARRQVAQRCIYGVDLNPLAVELSKVSLWLRTLAAEQPLAFLDHHLKTGNSLAGSDIETVLKSGDPDNGTEEGQLTLQESFSRTRRQALEHVTDRFKDLLAIDNETIDDIKEMESVYEEVRDDPLYQHLIAMANVHTAEHFGLYVPGDAYERMAEALRDDSWESIEGKNWYKSAQEIAEERRFFHWELEYPIAFYDQEGERKEDGGFDAVIGNPPWASIRGKHASSMFDDHEVEYLENKFPDNTYMPNAYEYFVSMAIDKLSEGGLHAFIVPDRLGFNSNLEYLRNTFLEKYKLNSLVYKSPFPGVIADTLIYVIKNANPEESYNVSVTLYEEESVSVPVSFYQETGDKALLYFETEDILNVLMNIDGNVSSSITDYAETTSGVGGKSGAIFEEKTDEAQRPIIKGADIERYAITNYHYFEFIDENITGRTRDKRKLGYAPKVLLPKTGAKLDAALEEDGIFPEQSAYFLYDYKESVSPGVLLSIMNSKLFQFYYSQKMVTNRDSTPQLKKLHLDRFPLPDISQAQDIEHDNDIKEHYSSYVRGDIGTESLINKTNCKNKLLDFLSNEMIEYCSKRTNFNLDILDYLGIPSDELPDSKAGETLGDLQMPVAGVADTPLSKTTDEYQGLRIEGVSFADDGDRVVLSVDISYKVGEDDPRETDRWGRLTEAEFETYEAMAFVDFSGAEVTLWREFVPVAIEEGNGFANFRQDATKTNSPLDRLKDLTLPNIDKVQTGLEQYIEVRERADELDKKIEKTDQLIDRIVYDLYGLTDEEIEIVESAVQDD